MERKISNYEAICGFLIISIANLVLTSGKILIKSEKSASILNSLFVSILALLIFLIMSKYLKKFNGKNLIDLSEILGGKYFKFLIGFLYIVYFFIRYAIFLRKIGDAMQLIYYPLTHIVFIIALITISSGIVSSIGNNSIFKSTSILLPLIYSTIILIFIGNSKNFNFNNIFPILGNGLSETFLSGSSNIFVFNGLIYLYFIPHKLKNPEKIQKIGIIFWFFNFIYLLFCISDIVLLFNNVTNHSELPPLYMSVRYIEFGTFFQRLDSAAIFIYILGLLCTLAINLTITLDIIKQITNISNTKPLLYPCLLISFSIALSLNPNTVVEIFENQISKALYIILVIIIPLFIFIFTTLKQKNEKKEAISESIH